MKTLEIIHLRSVGTEPDDLYGVIAEPLTGLGSDAHAFTCYRRVDLGTDMAIHILRDKEGDGSQKSDIGLRLAQSLKHYGMVEHTVWEKLRNLPERRKT